MSSILEDLGGTSMLYCGYVLLEIILMKKKNLMYNVLTTSTIKQHNFEYWISSSY